MNCSSSVFMTWRRCVVRGNIAEMVNRNRCICLLLMGTSKATMLMSSSVADSGHLLGGKSLLSICISNQTKQLKQLICIFEHGKCGNTRIKSLLGINYGGGKQMQWRGTQITFNLLFKSYVHIGYWYRSLANNAKPLKCIQVMTVNFNWKGKRTSKLKIVISFPF